MSPLAETLIRHEGKRYKPYVDTVGKLTIGVGRNLTDVGLYEDEIALMLANDIVRARLEVETKLPWASRLDQDCQDVLVNMCFNMGITRLLGFKRFLGCLRVGAFEEAAVEMLDSKWADQVGNRAVELAKVIRSKARAT